VKRGITRPEPKPRANDGIRGEIMTLHQVADYLNCHYTTAYRLVRQSGLPTLRLGSDYRIRRADLEEWIAQQRVLVEKTPLTDSEPQVAKPLPKSRR
jgi:excisionase family DNA binding protein